MLNMYQMGWGGGPMMWGNYDGSTALPVFFSFITLAVLWSLVWKGLGLWHAAHEGKPWWFIAILLISSFGLLEIFYLFAIEKKKFNQLFSMKKS